MLRLSFTNLNKHNQELAKYFNSGKFASEDYKRMWHLRLDRGWKVIYIGSPSFLQLARTAWVLWDVDNVEEVDRSGHPVLMNIYSVRPDNLEPIAEPTNRVYYKREG